MMPYIILTGPTGSGKTELSIELAKAINGEIICCDSMQLYKGLDIGTAKPSAEEFAKAPHHLFSFLEPDQGYSVGSYVDIARSKAKALQAEGKVAIFCGGTGQYVQALAEGLKFVDIPVDFALRAELSHRYDQEGGQNLLDIIKTFDPQTANRLAVADKKRIVRALEVYYQTGKSITEHNELSRREGPEHPYMVFAISMERQKLYERINQRVDLMMQAGLLDEVNSLYQTYISYNSNSPLATAIGYKEFLPYLNGQGILSESLDKIRQNSRNYAKRQLSLLRQKPYVTWLNDLTTQEKLVAINLQLPRC